MANSDKDILITPATGTSSEPSIVFTGGDNISINLNVLDNGTLSFEGNTGQLFSISDSLSGTIFSVNDVSGIPSIEVLDDGTIKLAEFGGTVEAGGTIQATDFNSTSDRNKKENVVTIMNALDTIKQIEGVEFTWKNNNNPSRGVIAQDLEQVLGSAVSGEEGNKSVNYNEIIAVLVEAVKELSDEVERLKNK